MAIQEKEKRTILRRNRVEARIGLGRSFIYEGIAAGTFPRPISIGSRAVGWIESEIDDWIEYQIQLSRGVAGGVKPAPSAVGLIENEVEAGLETQGASRRDTGGDAHPSWIKHKGMDCREAQLTKRRNLVGGASHV